MTQSNRSNYPTVRPATYDELKQRGLTDLTFDEAIGAVRHGATATRLGTSTRVAYREIGDGGSPVWGPAVLLERGWTAYEPSAADRQATDWLLVGFAPTA